MKQLGLAAAVVVALGTMSAVAAADEVPRRPAAARQKTIVLDPVPIVGRHHRPIAAVDVQRVRPKLGVRDLKPNLVDRIETAAGKDPF